MLVIKNVGYSLSMAPAIEIKNLSVYIDKKKILEDVSVNVAPGKVVGLLGPSGAGKTTLIRAILGLQKVAQGEITILDSKPGSKKVRSNAGYVTQAPSVYSDLTIAENMNYFAGLHGSEKSESINILKAVELDGIQDRLVASLSGGQRARVSLAVALIGDPELLLLDEPTVGLDPVLREKLWKMFADLADKGKTIIITSHVMDEADKCDELMFIRGGRLLAADTPAKIMKNTQTKTMEDAFLKLAKGDN